MPTVYSLDFRAAQDLPDQFTYQNTDPIRRFIETSFMNNSGSGTYPGLLLPSVMHPVRFADGSIEVIAEPANSAETLPMTSVGHGTDYSSASLETMLRWTDKDNFYSCQVICKSVNSGDAADNGSVQFVIWKRTAGVDSILASATENTDDWPLLWAATVKFEVIGTALKLYINGVQKVSTTDSDHSAAGIAGVFGNWGMGNIFIYHSLKWYDGSNVLIKDILFEKRPTRAILYGTTVNLALDGTKGIKPQSTDRAVIFPSFIDGDHTLALDVYLDGTTREFGLNLSWKWYGDYYLAWWSTGTLYIFSYVAATNTYSVLGSTAKSLTTGAHTLTFRRNGTSLVADLDGTTVSVTDSTIPDGGFCGMAFGASGSADVNFTTLSLTGKTLTVSGNDATVSTADSGGIHYATVTMDDPTSDVVRWELWDGGTMKAWQDRRIWARPWVRNVTVEVAAYPTTLTLKFFDKYGNHQDVSVNAVAFSAGGIMTHPGMAGGMRG